MVITDEKRTALEPEPIKIENVVRLETVNSSSKKKPNCSDCESDCEFKQPDRLFSKEENKRRNIERFNASGNGNLESSLADLSKPQCECGDPLSCIDPLWSLKKEQS